MYSLFTRRKEGNVLFNDALNTFYLRLYGVRHMVKDHSDSEKGNPLLPHRLLFSINSKGLLYAPSHRQDSTYHSLCYTSRGALAGTRNSLFTNAVLLFHRCSAKVAHDQKQLLQDGRLGSLVAPAPAAEEIQVDSAQITVQSHTGMPVSRFLEAVSGNDFS